jgi:hypothetical protein
MTWQPGQPTVTASDNAEWRAWCKTRKLEQQRERRGRYPRIDYYPSPAALAVIASKVSNRAGGDYSSVIDALIWPAADHLPE